MKKFELTRKRNCNAADMFDQPLKRMQELPVETCAMITGGQSLFYWMTYGFGFIAGKIGSLTS